MDNEKLFDFMTKMYADLKGGQDEMKSEISNMSADSAELKSTVTRIEIKIEQVVEPKIEALFDRYKQNSEQLNRIEAKVSEHDEVIIRRVK